MVVFMLGSKLVNWKSTCQHIVAVSTIKLEYMATTEEALWLKCLIKELNIHQNGVLL